jgi:signal peptidase II
LKTNSDFGMLNKIILIVLSVVIADQITKQLAKQYIYYGPGQIPLIGDWLKFTYTENPGIAFGLEFAGPVFITIFALLATIGIVIYLYKTRRNNIYYITAFGLIIGGAIGNLIDRFLYGRVIDFIHFDLYKGYIFGKYIALWPIFNIADSAITAGVAIMLIWYNHIFEELPDQSVKPTQQKQRLSD